MATTTNYGWTTPDDTALVKDGASAIRTLGSSVDTTTKALNPSTTLGDVEYRSSTANTNTRLAIGTTGQVLSVVGGVPAWAAVDANSMTLLSTTTLSGATTTISSISGSYKTLVAYIFGVTNATADGTFNLAPNGSSTITGNSRISNSSIAWAFSGNSPLRLSPATAGVLPTSSNSSNAWTLEISNYASTTARKSFQVFGGYHCSDTDPDLFGYANFGVINTTSAITSLVFSNAGGNLSTGTVLLYGVK
jgi:hypothetical protein